MKIDYPTNNFGDYMVVHYGISVRCKDDGAHFPYFTYNDYILLRGENVNKTDDELYSMVIEHMKNNYKKHQHITLDEQLEDSAFEEISISISKEVCYAKEIKITK